MDKNSSHKLEKLRELCLSHPETSERLSHGEPTWFYKEKKVFVMYSDRHHNDRVALICAAPVGIQEALVEAEPERSFRPPYVGQRGWIGLYLDVEFDWEEVAGMVEEAFRIVTKK